MQYLVDKIKKERPSNLMQAGQEYQNEPTIEIYCRQRSRPTVSFYIILHPPWLDVGAAKPAVSAAVSKAFSAFAFTAFSCTASAGDYSEVATSFLWRAKTVSNSNIWLPSSHILYWVIYIFWICDLSDCLLQWKIFSCHVVLLSSITIILQQYILLLNVNFSRDYDTHLPI